MSDFQNYLAEQLTDPEFRQEWNALQPERAIAQAMIDARERTGMTQKKLSEMTGIAQGDISRIEHGAANPSLKTLQRLADGLGLKLVVSFQPASAE